jgi:hypothetical protein
MANRWSKRTSGGKYEIRPSSDVNPMAVSISRRSESDFGKYRNYVSCIPDRGEAWIYSALTYC